MESMCQADRSGSRSKFKYFQGNIAESLNIFEADWWSGLIEIKRNQGFFDPDKEWRGRGQSKLGRNEGFPNVDIRRKH